MIVYVVENLITSKKYIGQHASNNLLKYWNHCVRAALRGETRKRVLYKAIRKYGKNAFQITPLIIVGSKEDLDFYEKQCINIFQTRAPQGYNLTDGGEGCSGYKHTPETLAKLSASLKGRTYSEETKKIWSQQRKGNKSRTGQKRSEEERKKQGVSMLGKKNVLGKQIHTEEHKKELSEQMKGNTFALGYKHTLEWRMAASKRMREKRAKH